MASRMLFASLVLLQLGCLCSSAKLEPFRSARAPAGQPDGGQRLELVAGVLSFFLTLILCRSHKGLWSACASNHTALRGHWCTCWLV